MTGSRKFPKPGTLVCRLLDMPCPSTLLAILSLHLASTMLQSPQPYQYPGGFPKLGVLLGVPIIRIIVYLFHIKTPSSSSLCLFRIMFPVLVHLSLHHFGEISSSYNPYMRWSPFYFQILFQLILRYKGNFHLTRNHKPGSRQPPRCPRARVPHPRLKAGLTSSKKTLH